MPRRIGLLFNPERSGLRRVITGITAAVEQRGWAVTFLGYDPGIFQVSADLLHTSADTIDGAIVGDTASGRLLADAEVPVVVLGDHPAADAGYHLVGSDVAAMGRAAADHLLDRQLRSLAVFANAASHAYADRRKTHGFEKRATEARVPCSVLLRGPRTLRANYWRLEDQVADLGEFMLRRPRPLGLMATDPTHSLRALAACREHGLRVPDDVAVICAHEEDVLFENVRPSLTGMLEDQPGIGRTAVEVLERVFGGQPTPRVHRLPPVAVNARQSTDVLAVDDDEVRAAVRYIWGHVAAGVAVEDVLDHVVTSRSTLRRKFLAALGRNPGEEIRRSRVETARRLLTTTDTPLPQVAAASGFRVASVLSREVRRATGQSPSELRRAHRRPR